MQLVDTHCHIHFDDFLPDPDAVLQRAKDDGVSKMVCVGVSLEDSQKAINFASGRSGVWATAGAHPHDGKDFLSDKNAIDKLSKLFNEPKVVGIGEIGLDYYHEYTARKDQHIILHQQIEAGANLDLPFVFHVRDAWSDFWPIFDKYKNIKGVIHSFTGGPKQLEQALSRRLHVALNGIVTFSKDQGLLEAAKRVPSGRLVLETDAPFLLPAGGSGTCEPRHTRLTAQFLAELRGEALDQLAATTTKNAIELFGLK